MKIQRSTILKKLDAATQEYISIIAQTAGKLGTDAYLVGGPVRDLMLNRGSIDLDIVVKDDGINFAAMLANQIRDSDLTAYRERLTATISVPQHRSAGDGTQELRNTGVQDGRHIDIATMRAEVYDHPGALPRVEAVSDIRTDLSRRDFTINAMALKLNDDDDTELIDPFHGCEAIQSSVVRSLHPKSFIDDPTRIYRAIRFEVRLGFKIEEQTLKAIKSAVSGNALRTISGQRCIKEINLYLAEDNPFLFINRAYELGAVTHIISSHKALEEIKDMYDGILGNKILNAENKRLLLLAALFIHNTPNEISNKADYFGMTKKQRTTITDTKLILGALKESPSKLNRIIKRYGDNARLLAYIITKSKLLLPYIAS